MPRLSANSALHQAMKKVNIMYAGSVARKKAREQQTF